MKKLGIFFIGLLLGVVIGYLSYELTSEKEQTEVQKPAGLISPEEALSLDKAFNLKHRIISDSLFKNAPNGDNRSSWWSLNEIENYIAYAKNQAKTNGYVLNGLRLYLGSYPDTNSAKGLTTMFFIPTGYKNNAEGGWLYAQKKYDDLEGAEGLNIGQSGNPPDANYPQ